MTPKALTIAAVAAGGLWLVLVASIWLLSRHSTRASRHSSEFGAVTRPVSLVESSSPVPSGDSEPAAHDPAPIMANPLPMAAPVRVSNEPAPTKRETSELLDEMSLLSNLHDLAAADPPRSLQLAREAVDRFPGSANAPEFEWNAVKALFNMGRLEEAKNEAQLMLRRYPQSSFTGDVIHHLLNPQPNPPGAP